MKRNENLRRWLRNICLFGVITALSALPAMAINQAPEQGGVPPTAVTVQASVKTTFSPGISDILKMADAKVDVAVLKTYIKNSPTAYNPSANEIVILKQRGLSDDVLSAILQRGGELRAQAQSAPAAIPGQAPAPMPSYDYGTEPSYPYAESYPYSYPAYSYPYYSYPYYSSYAYDYGYPWPFYSYPSFYFGYYPYRYRYPYYFHHYPYYSRFGRYPHNGFRTLPVRNFGGRTFANQAFRSTGNFHSFGSVNRGFGSVGHMGGGFHGGGGSFHGGGGFRGGGGGFHGGGGGFHGGGHR